MVKVALIADTHFGVRNNDDNFHNNMELFFSKVFFPELKKRGITKVIHLGDVFDNRRSIDVKTARRARDYFFDPLLEAGIRMDVLAGNHDLYRKETSEISTLEEFVSKMYDNITIYSDATQVSSTFLYVPWINKANREKTMETIKSSTAPIVLGHLELTGQNYSRVQVATHGDDPNIFDKFKHVYSGHYHFNNTLGNITYLGSATEHTWVDFNTRKGFHVFDTETHEIEMIRNPYNIFEYVDFPGLTPLTPSDLKQHIRVNVGEDVKQTDLEQFTRELEKRGALSVTLITPKAAMITNTEVNGEALNVEDSVVFMKQYVTDEKEYAILIELYNAANELI